jgi:hypothetical protein
LPQFDRLIIADWSASGTLSPARPSANAIWLGDSNAEGLRVSYHRSRAAAETVLAAAIDHALANGQRLLIGFDFAMGYPQGFAAGLTGTPRAQEIWAWLHRHLTDAPDNANNRFDVANLINAQLGGSGPFWAHPSGRNYPNLQRTKQGVDHARLAFAEHRQVEKQTKGAKSVWMLTNPGAVGSQSLVGLPMIHRLAQVPGVAVWPFATHTAPVILAEVYPSLLAPAVAADPAPIKDEVQVRLLSRALYAMAKKNTLTPLFDTPAIAREEGWILGAGHATALLAAL